MNDGMPWRQLERLEPAEQKLLSFAARSLRDHLIRYPDDASGMILTRSQSCTDDLMTVLGVRANERRTVRKAIEELIDDGFLVIDGTRLFIRNFGKYQGLRAPVLHQSSASGGQQRGSRTAESARKAAYRERKRAQTEGDMSTDKSGTTVPPVPNGTVRDSPGQDMSERVEERRVEEIASGTDVPGHGTRDTGQLMSRPEVPPAPPSAIDSRPSCTGPVDVPCPPDLRLDDGRVATLETAMIPRWAIDQLTAVFVAKNRDGGGRPRPLDAWMKCLVRSISGDWNNPERRPKQVKDKPAKSETAHWMG